eukprot:ANDGO_01891.mRNA.1 Calcium-transporting ATPase 3
MKHKSDLESGLHSMSRQNVHGLSVDELKSGLGISDISNQTGLPLDELFLDIRRRDYGSNVLATGKSIEVWKLLFSNFVNPMSAILGVVAVISGVNADWIEFVIVVAIIFINGILGFYQEYGSERALEALKRMTSGSAHVIRNGNVIQIPIDDVVVGDICELEQGQQVPADMRLFEVNHLEIDESLLTGESLPVRKIQQQLPNENVSLGDRKNLAFRQTAVLSGRGRGIVYAVGMQTQIGMLASQLAESTKVESQLQSRLNRLMYTLLVCAIILAGIVFAVNQAVDSATTLYASALGVAIIPESLLVTITVSMTVGVRRMAHNKAIVRKLSALEVLSSLTDICSDKTGTLTEGKMVAVRMIAGVGSQQTRLRISGPPLSKFGDFYFDKQVIFEPQGSPEPADKVSVEITAERRQKPTLELFFTAVSLCSTASVIMLDEEGDLEATGNPTEVALQVLCWKARIPRRHLENNSGWRRRGEWAFNSTVKMMSVGYLNSASASFVFSKGAPERIVAKCTHYAADVDVSAAEISQIASMQMTDDARSHLLRSMTKLAALGLRVLAVAYRSDIDLTNKDIQDYEREDVEKELIFLGLVGIFDPPRPESAPAVVLCKRAGIRVRMLTGDVAETAKSIAKHIGILNTVTNITTTGMEFDSKSAAELDAMEELPFCVARCSPETKVKMVKALQRRKRVVLMTGDGINDAPALKTANVGVAMGSGSDVTKGAADIVLTNDSFAVIVKAIAEGRRIFNSLKNFTFHLLSANVSQVVALVIGLAFLDEDGRSVFILSPVAILFVNTLSGLATMGLAFDKPAQDIMHRPPNTEGLFTTELLCNIIITGFAMGILTLVNFIIVMFGTGDGDLRTGCNSYSSSCETVADARTTALATMHTLLMIQTYVVRSGRHSLFKQHFFDNRFLWVSVVAGLLALIPVVYIPAVAEDVFHQTSISWEWGLVVGAVALYLLFTELYTVLQNKFFPEKLGISEIPDVPSKVPELEVFNSSAEDFESPVAASGGLETFHLRSVDDGLHYGMARRSSFHNVSEMPYSAFLAESSHLASPVDLNEVHVEEMTATVSEI